MGGCGMFAGFMALSFLPLSDAVAIGYASPLMTVVLAAVILKETVRAYRWTAVAIGFAGVLIMLLPHLDLAALARGPAGGPAVGVLFSLLAACCAAGATVQVRRLTATEKTGAIVFYFSLLTTALGLATIALGWRMPGWSDVGLLVVTGVLGGIGQILYAELPLRRCLARRAVRVHDDDLGAADRLVRLRPDAARLRHRRRPDRSGRRPVRPLAGEPAGAEARQGGRGRRAAAGLSRCIQAIPFLHAGMALLA